MTSKIREYQGIIYIFLAAVGVVLFILTSNEYLFNSSLFPTLTSIGDWGYYVFAVGIVMLIVFFYLFFKLLSDTRTFQSMINSESKQTFTKHLRDLERISRKLGPSYVEELKSTKERWKVK